MTILLDIKQSFAFSTRYIYIVNTNYYIRITVKDGRYWYYNLKKKKKNDTKTCHGWPKHSVGKCIIAKNLLLTRNILKMVLILCYMNYEYWIIHKYI